MTDINDVEVPKRDSKDAIHSITRALISAIPLVGGPGAELFQFILSPPLEKRRDAWMNSVAVGLKKLEKQQRIVLELLSSNESFVTTLIHSTQLALRNHDKTKLDALRNIVLNSAIPPPPEKGLQEALLATVAELSPWHIELLMKLPRDRGPYLGISAGKLFLGDRKVSLSPKLTVGGWRLSSVPGNLDFGQLHLKLWNELEVFGLVILQRRSSFKDVEDIYVLVSDFGQRLLDLISDPNAA